MNTRNCADACGGGRRRGGAVRLAGLLFVLALLFSGDLVRIHGHPDGAPASIDCAACVAGLAAAIQADPPPLLAPPVPHGADQTRAESAETLPLPFVRQGGLRDPPLSFA